MAKKIKVLLVDDENGFARLFKKKITRDPRFYYLGHASCKTSGFEKSCKLEPDIVVMDFYLAGDYFEGIGLAKEIRLKTKAKIVFLTRFENPSIMHEANKKAFASGYVFKSQMNNIADIIYDAATKNTPLKLEIQESVRKELTSTQILVLDSMLKDNKEILNYAATKTIVNHKTKIYKKLGLKNKKELLHVFSNW